jgi:hypothetical protein
MSRWRAGSMVISPAVMDSSRSSASTSTRRSRALMRAMISPSENGLVT